MRGRDTQTLRLEWVVAGSLTPNPKNWRRHPDTQMRALRDVLEDPEIGWAGACLFNEKTGRLIDGHARCKTVPPETLVPVLIGSWSEESEKKILLTLDPLTAMAAADNELLQQLLAEVDLETEALEFLGADLQALSNTRTNLVGGDETLDESADGQEFDESAADDVTTVACPQCGHVFPK